MITILIQTTIDAGKSFHVINLDSNPHWAHRKLTLVCLCAWVNILWKHVQVYMCVCSDIFVDMAMRTENMRFGVGTNHREIEGVIGHLYMSTWFYCLD